MKRNEPVEKEETLSRTLRVWNVDASLPPRFQEAVWRRIARVEGNREASGWKEFWRMVEAAFRRPALAVSYVAVLMLIGLGAGLAQARQASARMDQTLGARYVQAVDPYHAPRH